MFSEQMDTIIAKTFNLRSPKGDVGIEIETEGRNLPAGKVTGTFIGKEDGSLRHGMEYVSTPTPAKEAHVRVSNLAAKLVEHGAIVEPTYRSSTHIHVNYCDYRWRDVLGTMVAWAVLEPVVFSMMPPGRDGSLFCVSSYDSGDLADYTDQLCGQIGNSFGAGYNPRGKYSSLNLTRLSDLGTMEYRVFPSSMDGKQIQTWVDWVINIRTLVQKQDDPSFLTLVREAEQSPNPFLESIFGHADIPGAQEYVDYGARQGFELARVISRHLKAPVKKPQGKKVPVQDADGVVLNIPGVAGNWVQHVEVAPAQPVPPFPGFAARAGVHRRPRAQRAGPGPAENGGVDQAPAAPGEPVDRDLQRYRRNRAIYAAAGNRDMMAILDRRIASRLEWLAAREARRGIQRDLREDEF
jgi:hypothetical protein